MQLCQPGPPSGEAHLGDAFQFPPPSFAILLAKTFDFTDPRADGDCLNAGNFTNDVNAHTSILAVKAFKARPLEPP